MIVWNASIGHSSDHATLHTMFERHQPLPAILQVKPPMQAAAGATESLYDALPEQGREMLETVVEKVTEAVLRKNPKFKELFAEDSRLTTILEGFEKSLVDDALKHITLTDNLIPLCWPSDLVWARMAILIKACVSRSNPT